jgi:hypothetical protein
VSTLDKTSNTMTVTIGEDAALLLDGFETGVGQLHQNTDAGYWSAGFADSDGEAQFTDDAHDGAQSVMLYHNKDNGKWWAGFGHSTLFQGKDLTPYTKISFWIKASRVEDIYEYAMKTSSGVEYKYHFHAAAPDTWEKITILFTAFSNAPVNKPLLMESNCLLVESDSPAGEGTLFFDTLKVEP